jgi:hypothetical protein
VTTLGQRLGELRRRAFTGRAEEIALFRAALTTPGVVFLHGPGGVGKSALLDAYAEIAAADGLDVLRADARDVGLGPDRPPLPVPGGRAVVLIDTYELLEPLDSWVRGHYLPSLPAETLVVLAGRNPPGPGWRADPAWRELLRVRALGNLSPADGKAYLAGQRLPQASHARLMKLSHGHPLTLSMLADAERRGTGSRRLGDLPGVVSAVLARMIDEVPGPAHRTALEICARLPVTTEELLRTVLGDDAGPLFSWLRTLSFVEEGPRGLYPHDVVRAALDADLRWRDPIRYGELARTLAGALLEQVRATRDPAERLRLVTEEIVLAGTRSRVESCTTPPATAEAYADEPRDGDRAAIAAMTLRWQGPEQARLAASWLDRDPAAFRVFRTPAGEPRGYAACLDLTDGPGDSGDPGAEAMWRYAGEHMPPRPGERIRAWRFFVDRDHGQRPSPSTTLFAACQTLAAVTLDDTACTLIGAYADGEAWGPTMEHLDYRRAAGADYTAGGTTWPVYAHDWRRTDAGEWIALLSAREAGRRDTRRPEIAVLSRPDFAAALRAALRDLGEPERLAGNPLLRSRAVLRGTPGGSPPAAALRDLIEAGTATLPAPLGELVEHTFLRHGGPQERVAELLHLSFNTYRRRRDKAVDQLTDWLWSRETGS